MATKKTSVKKAAKSDVSTQTIEHNLDGLTQAGVLMACADGELEESEIAVLAEVMSGILQELGLELTEEVFVAKVEESLDQFTGKEVPEMLALIAGNISNREVGQVALALAGAVMLSDEEYSDQNEGPLYMALGEALGFSSDESVAILNSLVEGAE
jgi:tellurite resistance protein